MGLFGLWVMFGLLLRLSVVWIWFVIVMVFYGWLTACWFGLHIVWLMVVCVAFVLFGLVWLLISLIVLVRLFFVGFIVVFGYCALTLSFA